MKKDTSIIDKEDTQAMKKLRNLEPRKKYALIHEQIGIFIIGKKNTRRFLLFIIIFSTNLYVFSHSDKFTTKRNYRNPLR